MWIGITTMNSDVLKFGDVELDLTTGVLRRQGSVVEVEPQVFALIVHLAARPGELVSRDDLIEAVWGGRIVSESAIATRINAARAALGDDGKAQKVIQTVPRRGFRFVGAAAQASNLTLPDKPSIAVLPLENMSGDQDQEFFSDGIADDIITELARYDELFVIARNSSFAYKDRRVDVREIAGELGVQYMLEGSVRRADGRVRVTAQLIDTASGSHVWAERYDRDLEDIFAVQDEIAAVIVNTLVPTLTHRHSQRMAAERGEGVAAYDHLWKAMDPFWKLSRESNAQTREEALAAVAIDPRLARAHALLAWTHIMDGANRWGGVDQAEAFREGLTAATTSVALDDREPWAHCALGFVDLYGFHAYERALNSLRRSVELNPNNSYFRGWLSMGLNYDDQTEEALKEIKVAMRLNPHHPPLYLNLLGRILYSMGRYEEALPPLQRLVYAMPDYTGGLCLAAACLVALSRVQEAQDIIVKVLHVEPTFSISALAHSAPYRDAELRERYASRLAEAGLPRDPPE
jgi:TolB-like protein/Flp pilus assembly protein TadD